MNTAKNTTRVVVDMAAPTMSSASVKRMNTAPEGKPGHNGKVLAWTIKGVTSREVNQLAETGNVYSPKNLFTSVFPRLLHGYGLLLQFVSLQHGSLHLLKPPGMDSCIACQLRVEASAEDIALSNGHNVSNFLVRVAILAFRG